MSPLSILSVEHGSGSYDVTVGESALSVLGQIAADRHGRRVLMYGRGVPDEHVSAALESLEGAEAIPFDDGERAKTLQTIEAVCGELLDRGFRRDSIGFIMGGGTAGDTGGLAAALFMRGIPFVHVPTTLLAQVDSSIGGKLAVNHRAGKNMIGVFQPPVAVVADTSLLATLGEREWRSGLYEIVKAAVIDDRELFDLLEENETVARLRESERRSEVIARAIAVKAKIVSEDEREGDRRRLLNLGHTLGHGIEAAGGYEITHGDAVAWGMIAAVSIARERRLIDGKTADRIDRLILGFAPEVPSRIEPEEVMEIVENDKKFQEGKRVMILPVAIGHCEIVEVSREEIAAGLEAVRALLSSEPRQRPS